ncbi:MAG: hypothetical protein WCF65_02855 [Parachlamydiaceae bacterium]
MIKPIDFLTEKNRCEILDKIYQLKPYWNDRKPMFCTLGTALYLDATSDFMQYQSRAEASNKILREHFSALYQLLKDVLQKELKNEVAYADFLALPGFHIFSAPQSDFELSLIRRNATSIHFDLQFLQAQWPYKDAETSRPISFTATIKLPAAGGGLNYWDITREEYQPLSDTEKEVLLHSKERHYCPYEEGKIVIHDGFTLHQIAVQDKYETGDVRITLQGHAIRCDGTWRVYW